MATNKIEAKIVALKNSDDIFRVDLETKSGVKLALVCFNCEKNIEDVILVGVNPTNVAISKKIENLSISNQIPAQISSIENGEVLTKISAKFEEHEICAIITRTSSDKLGLKAGENAFFLIKSTDMFIV